MPHPQQSQLADLKQSSQYPLVVDFLVKQYGFSPKEAEVYVGEMIGSPRFTELMGEAESGQKKPLHPNFYGPVKSAPQTNLPPAVYDATISKAQQQTSLFDAYKAAFPGKVQVPKDPSMGVASGKRQRGI